MLRLGARFTIGNETQFDLTNTTTSVEGSDDELILGFGDYELSFLFAEAKPLQISRTWKLLTLNLTVTKNGKTRSASLTEEEGVDSIVARNENSWACDHPMEFDLTGDFDVTISTVNFRIQPYITENEFGQMERCEADEFTNNVVPIAVGVALAVLVVLVLVLYLIGRRRHQRGYQTV